MTQTPDGVFVRPHPGKFIYRLSKCITNDRFLSLALWRLVLCFSVLYEIVLIYILFQVNQQIVEVKLCEKEVFHSDGGQCKRIIKKY